MNQPPPRLAQQQSQHPQKEPHHYSFPILITLVISYILALIFTGIGSINQSSTNPHSQPLILNILDTIGIILLLLNYACTFAFDWHGFITLYDRIDWKRLKGWQRAGLIILYCSLLIMPAIYFSITIKHYIEVGHQAVSQTHQNNSSSRKIKTLAPQQTGSEFKADQQVQGQPQVANIPELNYRVASHQSRGRRTFKIILYFIGVLLAIFFMTGLGLYATNMSNVGGYVGLLVGVIAAGISIFIFFHNKYHIHYLRWREYMWWLLGITVAFIMLVIFVTTVLPLFTGKQTMYIILDIVFLLYGIGLIWIAHMKPSLAQQINESVYRILKAEPAKQMALPELITHLQKEYKHQDTLNQYLGNLDYIEQVNVPGTSIILCRLKPPKQTEPVLPMKHVPVAAPYPQATSVSPPVRAPAQKVMIPPSTQTNPQISPSSKETFVFMPEQKITPATPESRPNQMPVLPPVQSEMPMSSQRKDVLIPPTSQEIPPPTLEPIKPSRSLTVNNEQQAIKIFCCYAHADEQLLKKLRDHLKPQQRQGLIQIWHDRDISAGTEWELEIEEQLNTAQIILLLVSPDFMASDYCYTKEMQQALERDARGEVRLIPIILRPTDWQETPLGKLQALPKNGKPITTWSNRDEAYLDVARGIRVAVTTFLTKSQQSKKQVTALNDIQAVQEEGELIHTRCKQGELILTNKRIVIQLSTFGRVLKPQTLLRSSLTSIESKLVVAPILGMGGGYNLTFHGKGREELHADLVPPKEAKEIIALLS